MISEAREASVLASLVFEIPYKKLLGLNVGMIDGYVNIKNESYRENTVPLGKLRKAVMKKPLPTTSAPNLYDFSNAYRHLLEEAKTVCSIHQSGELASTVDTANTAARIEELPVTVFDSRFIGMAGGFIALEAARVANQGAKINEVIEAAKKVQSRVGLAVLAYPQSPMIESRRYPGSKYRVAGKTVLMDMNDGKMEIKEIYDNSYTANESLVQWLKKKVGDSLVKIAVSCDFRIESCVINDLFLRFKSPNVEELFLGSESPHFTIHLGKALRFSYLVNEV